MSSTERVAHICYNKLLFRLIASTFSLSNIFAIFLTPSKILDSICTIALSIRFVAKSDNKKKNENLVIRK